jgi:protein SCO1/2
VYVKKVPDPKSTAGYTMDHSSIIYVLGPDGSYRMHFTHATSPDVMAGRLSGMLQRPTM